MKLSLGQAAKHAGVSKSTLQRMLKAGAVSGTQRADSVWEIDQAEVARIARDKDRPRSGKRVEAGEPPPPDPAVDLAVLKVQLQDVRDRLAEAVRREEAAEARAAETLARERDLVDRQTKLIEDKNAAEARAAEERARIDRLSRLIEDQRTARGFWDRLLGRG